MIVSHQHQFVFVKTAKTAGTSIEIALSDHCGPNDIVTPIFHKDEVLREVGPQNTRIPLRSRLRGVGSVRQRLAGQYWNHMPATYVRSALGQQVWDQYLTFTVERNPYDRAISKYWWATRNDDPRPSLLEFLAAGRYLSNWPKYAIDDQVGVDLVLRYESLEKDLAELSDRLALDIALPQTRAKGNFRADRRPYQEVLRAEERAVIERVCAREFETFGYDWL